MPVAVPLPLILGLLLCSIALLVVGMFLRSRGYYRSRRAWLVWTIISVLPLLGGGLFLFTKHQIDMATGKTGIRNDPAVPGRP